MRKSGLGILTAGLLWAVTPLHATEPADITAPMARATELYMATAAATAVVGGMQDKINQGSLAPQDLERDRLQTSFREALAKTSGASFAAEPDPERARIRAIVADGFERVVDRFRADMLKGGQDAFVPAFFRAQLMEIVNQTDKDGYLALATNREADLINLDWSAERQIKDAAVLAYVKGLLERGEASPQSQLFEHRLVTFWPMKIAEPCAACHARNGLKQTVGQFGGATVVIVEGAH